MKDPEVYRRLAVVGFILYNICTAFVHFRLIKAAEKQPRIKIKHGWWAYLYLGVVSLTAILTAKGTAFSFDWFVLGAGIFVRKPTFDIPLNFFRFGPKQLFYISPEVKETKTLRQAIKEGETIDWIHWKLFKNKPWRYQIAYVYLTILFVYLM